MLQKFRNNLKGAGATILVLIIAVPFVFFGVDSLFLQSSDGEEVAEVNGESISDLELRRNMELYKNQLRNRFEGLDPDLLDDELVRGSVLDGLIVEKILQQKADDTGMAVPLDIVYSMLFEIPAYQIDGKFDVSRYQYIIRQLGYTPTSHARAIAGEMVSRAFRQGVVETGFVTDQEVNAFASLVGQKRDYYYLTIPETAVNSEVVIGDQEIQDYYASNQSLFRSPEQVRVEYVELKVSDLLDQVKVSEEEISNLFDMTKAEAGAAVQREVAHILLDPDATDYAQKLSQIQQRLAEGDDFGALAREFSDDPGSAESGGVLGFVLPGDLPEPLDQALAELPVGKVSPPVASDSGVHLLLVKTEQKVEQATLDEQYATLKQQIATEKAAELFLERVEAMREEAYNAASLADTAALVNATLKQSDFFSRDSQSEGIAAYPGITEIAFSEEVMVDGYPSEVLEIAEDHAVVLRVIEHKPESIRPLAEVAGEIKSTLIEQKRASELKAIATELEARISSGQSVEEIAKESGYAWQVSLDVTRNDGKADQEVRDFVFSLPAGSDTKVVDSFQKSDGEFVVVSLTGVEEGSTTAFSSQQLTLMSEQLATASANRDALNYQRYLEDKAKIIR